MRVPDFTVADQSGNDWALSEHLRPYEEEEAELFREAVRLIVVMGFARGGHQP